MRPRRTTTTCQRSFLTHAISFCLPQAPRGSVRRSSVSVAVVRRYYGAENATVDLRSLTEMSTEAAGKCEQRTNPFVVVTL